MEDTPQQSQSQSQSIPQLQRRCGRVEVWLRKGYGFVDDLGLVTQSEEGSFGWTRDELSGSKVFVYNAHIVLSEEAQDANVRRQLSNNEFVTYDVDPNDEGENGRLQAQNVRGLNGLPLDVEINANRPEAKKRQSRQRQSIVPPRNNRQPAQQIIYYVTQPPGQPFTPAPAFPPNPVLPKEPEFILPTSGMPVPK